MLSPVHQLFTFISICTILRSFRLTSQKKWGNHSLLKGGIFIPLPVGVLWVGIVSSNYRQAISIDECRVPSCYVGCVRCVPGVSPFHLSVPDTLRPKLHCLPVPSGPGVFSYTDRTNLLRCPTLPWFWVRSPYSSMTRTRSSIPFSKPILWSGCPRVTSPFKHQSDRLLENQNGKWREPWN